MLQQDSLEVSANKYQWWIVFVLCIFIQIAVGGLFIKLGNVGMLLLAILFVLFIPLTIFTFIKAIDDKPIIIIADDKIIYKHWTFCVYIFSEIEEVYLDDYNIKIMVADSIKYENNSLADKISGLSGNKYVLTIDTRLLEYNSNDLVEILIKKKNSPNTPILELLKETVQGKYVQNRVSASQRIFNIVASISILSYATYGLINGRLVIPAKRGRFELYGSSIYLMLVGAILLSAYLLSFVMDHYDRRNNEKTYNKIQKYTSLLGLTVFCAAIVVGLYQNERDYLCQNEIIKTIVSADASMNAYVVKRSCALYDPENCKTPIYGISVYDAQLDQEPEVPFNTADFTKCTVKDVRWEGKDLVIEYLADGPNWNASLRRRAPVSAKLVRIFP